MDFSEYGEPSSDWVRVIENNPKAPAPFSKDAKALRGQWLAMGMWTAVPPDVASKVTIKPIEFNGLRGRLYYPLSRPFGHSLLPLYFHLHGGGFLFGCLESSAAECARIAADLAVVVCHVEYRHTDVASYPAQHDDAWAAFRWAVESAADWGVDEKCVIVSGESAGANLAVGVAVRAAKENIHISLLHLGSPFLCRPSLFPAGLIADGKLSLEQHALKPGPPRMILDWFMDLLDPTPDPTNYDISPLLRPRDQWKTMTWPRTFIQVAGMDPLRDEGILFAGILKDAGIDVKYIVYAGLPHAFHHTAELEASKVYAEDHDKEVQSVLSRNLPRLNE